MLDQTLRVPKRTVFAPLARRLSLSPNLVTLLGLGAGLVAVGQAASGNLERALLFWVLNRLLDGLDGELAEVQGRKTDFGGYLDMMCDLLIYALLPVALTWGSGGSWWPVALLLTSFYLNVGSWMYLSAILEKRAQGATARGERTQVTMPSGLIEGGETILFYSLFLIMPGYLRELFLLFALLVFFTAGQRVSWAWRNL